MNVGGVRSFFLFCNLRAPKIFWCTKLFMYSNEFDYEDTFSSLSLLFHEIRVHPSEGKRANSLDYYQGRFQPFQTLSGPR